METFDVTLHKEDGYWFAGVHLPDGARFVSNIDGVLTYEHHGHNLSVSENLVVVSKDGSTMTQIELNEMHDQRLVTDGKHWDHTRSRVAMVTQPDHIRVLYLNGTSYHDEVVGTMGELYLWRRTLHVDGADPVDVGVVGKTYTDGGELEVWPDLIYMDRTHFATRHDDGWTSSNPELSKYVPMADALKAKTATR